MDRKKGRGLNFKVLYGKQLAGDLYESISDKTNLSVITPIAIQLSWQGMPRYI